MLQQMPVRWAEDIKAASGGRLEIEVHPAGALVPAPEVLDATTARTIDAYHTFAGYWIGKMPASPFFSSVPMTLEPFMHLVWVYEGGGLELWQRLYDEAGYNVKILPLGITHPEVLAWSNKPLRKIADWRGLKYRTVGWWAEILRGSDVAVTSLPAAELYPALERGVLDALEFSTPYNDRVLAFYQVAKYLTGPGMHQPGVLFYVGINKDSWNALPPDLQALLETSARSATMWSWAKDFNESMAAVDYFKEKGVEFVTVGEDVQKRLKEDTYAFLEKRAAEQGGIFAEIWNSAKNFRARFIQYEDLMVPVRVK
jgi:TRAP-type mannitol/chloroaromatic compound transport system substrate-binding protein